MEPKCAIVLTTINDGVILDALHDNLARFGRLDTTTVYVIPDRKTPSSLFDRADTLRGRGAQIESPSLDEQDEYLNKIGFGSDRLLVNSDHRRNVGYLRAYEAGNDIVISIDDDNYPIHEEDFVGGHISALNGSVEGKQAIECSTKFYNVCDLMTFDGAGEVYPRGYPFDARHCEDSISRSFVAAKPVHINAGLWLQDPDVDGISWLVLPRRATGLLCPEVILGDSTWTPINSQNTSMRADAIAAYYFVKMGYAMGGLTIDRYGDIFQGYFVQACAKALGGSVRAGTPAVLHQRNAHNFLNDSRAELGCMLILQELLDYLVNEARLEGSSYSDAYTCLADLLEPASEKFESRFWTEEARGFVKEMCSDMRLWAEVCKRLRG